MLADLNAVLLGAKDKDVVFFDEVHELPKEQQVGLYFALDQRKVILQGGRSGRTPQSIPIGNFTVLLATTDEYALLAPLRDRMKLVLRFSFYSVEELTTMLRHRSGALRWPVEEEVLPFIAQRSRGTPRLAFGCCKHVGGSAGRKAARPSPWSTWKKPVCWSRSTPSAWVRWRRSTCNSWPRATPGLTCWHHGSACQPELWPKSWSRF